MPKILIVVLCILLSLGLGIGLIWPKYKDFKSLEFEILQKTNDLKSRRDYLADIKNTIEELKKYPEALSKIESALPSEQSLPSLFDFIQKTSSQSGLVFANVGPVTVSSSGETSVKESNFQIFLTGSYSSFKNFLLLLEKSSRFIEVSNISFSSSEGSEPFSYILRLKVRSY